MPLPPGVTLITVTGTYNDVENRPVKGFVKFTPTIHTAGGGALQVPSPIIGRLYAGSFSVQLPTEVNPELAPDGWVYTVSERLDGGQYRDYAMALLETPTTVDLSTVVPVETPTQVSPYITRQENAKVMTVMTPAAIWNLTHGLGFFPSVSIEDSAGDICYADVKHLSDNAVRIDFGGRQVAGRVYFS